MYLFAPEGAYQLQRVASPPRKGADTMDKPVKNEKRYLPSTDPMAKAMAMTHCQSAKTDPLGSWTGVPADPEEQPVQDADDL